MNMFQSGDTTTPQAYLDSLEEPRKSELKELDALIRSLISPEADISLYGQIIGYVKYHYRSKSGREGDWPIIGLSSRKQYISLYVVASENGAYIAEQYKARLPKANIGKSCIRFKHLADVDQTVVREVIARALVIMSDEKNWSY